GQAERQLAHGLLDFGEAAVDPRAAVLELDRGRAAVHPRGARQQVRERGRVGSPLLHGGEVSWTALYWLATQPGRGARDNAPVSEVAATPIPRRGRLWVILALALAFAALAYAVVDISTK